MTSTCDCTFQLVNCEFVFLTKSLLYRQAFPASILFKLTCVVSVAWSVTLNWPFKLWENLYDISLCCLIQ